MDAGFFEFVPAHAMASSSASSSSSSMTTPSRRHHRWSCATDTEEKENTIPSFSHHRQVLPPLRGHHHHHAHILRPLVAVPPPTLLCTSGAAAATAPPPPPPHTGKHFHHPHAHADVERERLPSYFSSRGVDLGALALVHAARSTTSACAALPSPLAPLTHRLHSLSSASSASTATSTSSMWSRAPDDVLSLIFHCLPFPALLTCQRVNRTWSAVARDPYSWQHTAWNRSVDDAGLQRIARHLPYLRSVALPNSSITTSSVSALAALPHVTSLNLQSCSRFRTDALRSLLTSSSPPSPLSLPFSRRITVLNLHDVSHVNDSLVGALSTLTSLTSLHLGATSLTDAGFAALFSSLSSNMSSSPLSSPSSSTASRSGLIGTGIAVPSTAASPSPQQPQHSQQLPLRRVDLTRSKIGDAGLLALCTCFPHLTHVTLDDCDQLSEDGVSHLALLGSSLTHLSLIAPHLSPYSLLALVSLTHLASLSLGALCNDDVLVALATACPRLVHVSVPCSPITVRSLVPLARLPLVEHVHIAGCDRVSDTAKSALFDHSRWGTFHSAASRAEWLHVVEREAEREAAREAERERERAKLLREKQQREEAAAVAAAESASSSVSPTATTSSPSPTFLAPSHFPLHGYWQPCLRPVAAPLAAPLTGAVDALVAFVPRGRRALSAADDRDLHEASLFASPNSGSQIKFEGMGEDWMRTPLNGTPMRKRSSPSCTGASTPLSQ